MPHTPAPHRFILASASPRRKELLTLLGLPFSVVLPQAAPDETPRPGETPPELVQRLSRLKAQAAAAEIHTPPTAIIIAADTVVVLGDKILGKPTGPAEAAHMLKRLRQQGHHYVYSGLTVGAWPGGNTPTQLITRLHRSRVWMRPYTDAELATYVAGGDPLDKAGAYAIQNKQFAPVERLEGCFASVMGLPLGELAAAFRAVALSLPEIAPLCSGYSGQPCCQQ